MPTEQQKQREHPGGLTEKEGGLAALALNDLWTRSLNSTFMAAMQSDRGRESPAVLRSLEDIAPPPVRRRICRGAGERRGRSGSYR